MRKSRRREGPVVVRADDGGDVAPDSVQHVLANTLLSSRVSGGETKGIRHADVEESPTQSRIPPSLQRVLR